jgi:hypothetical protein
MTITRQEAAAEQIDQSIRLWREGYWASAVTLAGAAEEGLPPPEAQTLFAWLRLVGANALQIDGAEVADKHLNRARNWLKHQRLEDEVEITALDGFAMIVRAVSKFSQVYGEDAQTPTMVDFFDEIRGALREIAKPFIELLQQFRRTH